MAVGSIGQHMACGRSLNPMTKHAELHRLCSEWWAELGFKMPDAGSEYGEMYRTWERAAFYDHKLLRYNSHRAYNKLMALLNGKLYREQVNFASGRHYLLVPAEAVEQARAIKGVTVSTFRGNLLDCWE